MGTNTRTIMAAWLLAVASCGTSESESDYGTCIDYEPAPGLQTCVMSRPPVAGGMEMMREAVERARAGVRVGTRRGSPSLPSGVDHSYAIDRYCPPVHDQGGCGTCWAHTVTGSMEARMCQGSYGSASGDGVSVPHLLYARKGNDGLTEEGCKEGEYVDNGFRTAKARALVPDAVWPQPAESDPAEIAAEMASSAPSDAELTAWAEYQVKSWVAVPAFDVDALKSALANGYDVAYAVPTLTGTGWNSGDETYGDVGWPTECDLDALADCLREEHLELPCNCLDGFHAILIVGYDDGWGDAGEFLFRNSWGDDWAYGGYGYLAYDLVDAWGFGGGYVKRVKVL